MLNQSTLSTVLISSTAEPYAHTLRMLNQSTLSTVLISSTVDPMLTLTSLIMLNQIKSSHLLVCKLYAFNPFHAQHPPTCGLRVNKVEKYLHHHHDITQLIFNQREKYLHHHHDKLSNSSRLSLCQEREVDEYTKINIQIVEGLHCSVLTSHRLCR
jgi:hypothetical protein